MNNLQSITRENYNLFVRFLNQRIKYDSSWEFRNLYMDFSVNTFNICNVLTTIEIIINMLIRYPVYSLNILDFKIEAHDEVN